MWKPLAAAAVIAFVLFATGTGTAGPSLDGPKLIRVSAYTTVESGEFAETSDVLFVRQELRGSEGNRVGSGTQQCTVGLEDIATCLATYTFGKGQIMLQGTRRRRSSYVLAVTGGTGVYSDAGGVLLAETISDHLPRVERLLFSLEP